MNDPLPLSVSVPADGLIRATVFSATILSSESVSLVSTLMVTGLPSLVEPLSSLATGGVLVTKIVLISSRTMVDEALAVKDSMPSQSAPEME